MNHLQQEQIIYLYLHIIGNDESNCNSQNVLIKDIIVVCEIYNIRDLCVNRTEHFQAGYS